MVDNLSFGGLALRRFDAHEVLGDLIGRALRQDSQNRPARVVELLPLR